MGKTSRERWANWTAAAGYRRMPPAAQDQTIPSTTKWCPQCQAQKPISVFGRDRWTNDGLTTRCRVCRNAYSKAYGKANRPRLSAYRTKRRHEVNDDG